MLDDEGGAEEKEREFELIAAYDDAKLRLNCFREIRKLHPTMPEEEILRRAQRLYNWVMEYDKEGEEEPAPKTPEALCSPKRH